MPNETKRWFTFEIDDARATDLVKQEVQRAFGITDVDAQLENNKLSLCVTEELRPRIRTLIDNLPSEFRSLSGVPISRRKFVKNSGILLAASATASSLTPLSAAAADAVESFLGVWQTTFGAMTLGQDLSTGLLTGSYDTAEKRIVGTVSGKIFAGKWYRRNDADDWGPLIFILTGATPGESLYGYWGYSDHRDGALWNAVRGNPNAVIPTQTPFETDVSNSVVYDSDYGSLKMCSTGPAKAQIYVGTYDLGSVLLVKLGEHFGGVWQHPDGRNGVVAFERSATGHSGRWMDRIGQGGRTDNWALRSPVNTDTTSPYTTMDRKNKWIKGDLHNHVQNFTGTSENTPGAGGRITNERMMTALGDHGYSFVGLTGHECMPGTAKEPGGRNAIDIPDDTPGSGIVAIKTMENQAPTIAPNWLANPGNTALERNWQSDNGAPRLHRLYLHGGSDSFWVCHPNYYNANHVTQNDIDRVSPPKRNNTPSQKVRGVEVYNRYAEDRCAVDIEGSDILALNPFGTNLWDALLADPERDYPIWALASDCSFLHDAGGDRLPDIVRYRFGKGAAFVSVPEDFDRKPAPEKREIVINALESGQFYAAAGDIRFESVEFVNGHLIVEASEMVTWHVIGDHGLDSESKKLHSYTLPDGRVQCFTSARGSASTADAHIVAVKTDPNSVYTRVEARLNKSGKIQAVGPRSSITIGNKTVSARKITVSGDLTSVATLGELLHLATRNPPCTILSSSSVDSNSNTDIWLLDNSGAVNITDRRLDATGSLNALAVDRDIKIVRRAWLQPSWGIRRPANFFAPL